ncbi:tRNA lysidine(34) synthetase TilS [Altererythrobacter sp. Root672]|uniref:tRNA lysidine(34) synthetase TilS n=1 Tax=Altererythrobacter sp. Root672 TaxID=1736584 RepID=UPI0006FE6B21|nr:tRNA lysidine(34) synthetase TilS [Altererythrobacter sp. Root672]KRA82597.1 tRNA(Ile)-lysidine synthetase [Altererythrobacter sp. Root672]
MTAPRARSPAADAIPEALIERFSVTLGRLWPGDERLGLAVSGGPDSLAMLLLAQAAVPGRFEVASVDHGLRPEAADECAMVALLCAERGIPCEVLRVTVDGGNVQAAAREARYRALADWADRRGLSAIATAHHADDQAETLLMRLNRGSGVPGLAGVRESGAMPGSAIPLIRPLLEFRRQELGEVIECAAPAAAQDPSNLDDKYDRVRLRKALAGVDWLDVPSLARSATNLADADEALAWATEREWSERVAESPDELRYLRTDAPRAIVLRVAGRAIGVLGGQARGSDLARLIERLEAGGSGNLAGVLVTVERGQWVFRPEPPRGARR